MLHSQRRSAGLSSTQEDLGGDGRRASISCVLGNSPVEHPDPWTRSYYARQLMSRDEQMDDFLQRIGEPPHRKSGLAKEDGSLRFVSLSRRRAPFQAAFMLVSFLSPCRHTKRRTHPFALSIDKSHRHIRCRKVFCC